MTTYSITQEQLDNIVEIASREALKAYFGTVKKEQTNKAKDRVKRTRLMLDSYRRMKAVLQEETVFSPEEEMELRWNFLMDLMGNPEEEITQSERHIEDFEKRRAENLYALRCLEKATEMYQVEAYATKKDEVIRRCDVLFDKYINDTELTMEELVDKYAVTERTIQRDLKDAIFIVAVYLFGI